MLNGCLTEKDLTSIQERSFPSEEYREGYINALEGLLLSVRSGDGRDFYNRLKKSHKSLEDYLAEFKSFRELPTRAPFDQHADEIVVLKKGEIVERGTHTELVSKEGVYKRLQDLQSFE